MKASRWGRSLALVLSLAGLAALVTASHLWAAAALGLASTPTSELPALYLPRGSAVRAISLGQHTTIADLYFLRMVQYIGTPAAERAGWPQLLELAELVTDVDPLYGYPYEVAGLVLSSKGRFEESQRIYAKGMANVPQRWQLPFFAAYDLWHEQQDLAGGARMLMKAATIPGSPKYVSELASRLYTSAGQVDAALVYVETILAQGPPEEIREQLVRRRQELQLERDLQALERAIERFAERMGRPPFDLAELRGTVLPSLPLAPDGTAYQYDPVQRAVGHPLLPERLKYFRAKGQGFEASTKERAQ